MSSSKCCLLSQGLIKYNLKTKFNSLSISLNEHLLTQFFPLLCTLTMSVSCLLLETGVIETHMWPPHSEFTICSLIGEACRSLSQYAETL